MILGLGLGLHNSKQRGWNPLNWLYKTTITINNSLLTGDVSNYAVRIYLDKETFDFSLFKAGGADLRFADALNNLYHHEIDYWIDTEGSEEAVVWVLIPLISSTNNTFFMYYGNENANDRQQVTALWYAAGVISVWHFSELSGAAILDSSLNNADATMIEINTTPQRSKASGISSIQLNKYKIGTHEMGTEKIEGGNPLILTQLVGDFSVSVHYNLKDAKALMSEETYSILTVDKSATPGNLLTENFAINIAQSDQRPYINLGDGVLAGRTDELLLTEWGVTGMPLDVWHNFIGYVNGDYIRCYFDGSNSLENPAYPEQTFSVNGGSRQLGNRFGIGFPFPITADIDEIKVFNRALSLNEAKLESMNFKNTLLAVTDTEITLPDAPTGLTLTLISGGVRVAFTDNSGGAAKHEIWGKSDSGTYVLIVVLDEEDVSYDDTTPAVDLRYYKVRSRIINACSAFIEDSEAMVGAEMVGDVTFDGGWWNENGGTISGGLGHIVDQPANQGLYKIHLTIGKTYKIGVEIKNWVKGGFGFVGFDNYAVRTANGVYSEIKVAISTYNLIYSVVSNTTLDVDNVSVKEVLVP